ncbi:putative multidrug resistance protein MdtD [Streptomyces sp. RB5]|uniref:Putative multidrug resistance protein MdtD n=1 Tax=Streptomyces smaragdinus TaxID=2585196 RepID=A0A7K0CFK5_9ACTN|nr:MFS transporter [Streptomyces smaragdinus]MQY12176.1 putative multidrug resistance protein MdtD [Streptomyces smaragdinus]
MTADSVTLESVPVRSRWLALAVISTGALMIILDGSIVTVALPAIQRDLGFTPAGLTWTLNAYMIAFGGLLLLAGRLGDLVGRKNVFLAGLALFTLASLAGGLAAEPWMLVAARFLQGVGGALSSAVGLGMVVTLFPEPAERTRAMGVFAFTGAAGASIGQVLGGVLTDALSWHWIFFINLPIGLATALLAARVLPADRGLGRKAGADAPGAVLVTAGLMLGVYTIVRTEHYGWASAHTLVLGAVSLLLIAAFVRRQATVAAPLLPLHVFRSRDVAGANVVQLLVIGGMFSFQVIVALYMQQVLGYGAGKTGLAMLPAALMIGAVSLGLSARLMNAYGPRAVLLTGLALLTIALGLLLRTPATDAVFVRDLLPTMLLISGGGLVLPSMMTLGMSAARPEDAGVVSGLFNTGQSVGSALGVAVLSTLAAGRTRSLLASGHSRAEALTGGFHLAFAISTALVLTAAVLALTVLRPERGKAAV